MTSSASENATHTNLHARRAPMHAQVQREPSKGCPVCQQPPRPAEEAPHRTLRDPCTRQQKERPREAMPIRLSSAWHLAASGRCLVLEVPPRKSLHKEIGAEAAKVPDMPYTVSTDTASYKFDGSPRPWTEIIQKIALRFPRPLLGDDPFTSPPAATWKAAQQRADANGHNTATVGVSPMAMVV